MATRTANPARSQDYWLGRIKRLDDEFASIKAAATVLPPDDEPRLNRVRSRVEALLINMHALGNDALAEKQGFLNWVNGQSSGLLGTLFPGTMADYRREGQYTAEMYDELFAIASDGEKRNPSLVRVSDATEAISSEVSPLRFRPREPPISDRVPRLRRPAELATGVKQLSLATGGQF